MIQIPPNAKILVMHESINFRKGIDGTVAIARIVLEKNPMDGAIFVFRNKGRRMLEATRKFWSGGSVACGYDMKSCKSSNG